MSRPAQLTCNFLRVQILLCAALLLLVPTYCGWKLSRRSAWVLLGVYLLYQVQLN